MQHICKVLILYGIVRYCRFDRPTVDGFLTQSNNTHVRDCHPPTVIKTIVMMMMMMRMMLMIMMMMVMMAW